MTRLLGSYNNRRKQRIFTVDMSSTDVLVSCRSNIDSRARAFGGWRNGNLPFSQINFGRSGSGSALFLMDDSDGHRAKIRIQIPILRVFTSNTRRKLAEEFFFVS